MRKYLVWLFISFVPLNFSVFAEEDDDEEYPEEAEVNLESDDVGEDNPQNETEEEEENEDDQSQKSPEEIRNKKKTQVRSIVDDILNIRKKGGASKSGNKKQSRTTSKSVQIRNRSYRSVERNGRSTSARRDNSYSRTAKNGNPRRRSANKGRNSYCKSLGQKFYTIKKVNMRLAQPFIPQAVRKPVTTSPGHKKIEYKIKNWGENGTFRGSTSKPDLSEVYTIKNLKPQNYFNNKRKCCNG